jgi:N-succinyldiaminopimelate aminotransferase
MEDLREAEHPDLHRYSETQGLPVLVSALVEKLRARNRIASERAGVLVAAGATGALGAAVGTCAAPGEEVLVLAPFWPLIRGIVQAFRATPVEVPFYDRVDSAGPRWRPCARGSPRAASRSTSRRRPTPPAACCPRTGSRRWPAWPGARVCG